MTAIYPYLTFENAKEAMAYYEQDFSAQITYHEALTKEQAESLGLPVDQLDQTTMRGEFMIAGQKIICADATMKRKIKHVICLIVWQNQTINV